MLMIKVAWVLSVMKCQEKAELCWRSESVNVTLLKLHILSVKSEFILMAASNASLQNSIISVSCINLWSWKA